MSISEASTARADAITAPAHATVHADAAPAHGEPAKRRAPSPIRLVFWIRRYLPAEVVGTAAMIVRGAPRHPLERRRLVAIALAALGRREPGLLPRARRHDLRASRPRRPSPGSHGRGRRRHSHRRPFCWPSSAPAELARQSAHPPRRTPRARRARRSPDPVSGLLAGQARRRPRLLRPRCGGVHLSPTCTGACAKRAPGPRRPQRTRRRPRRERRAARTGPRGAPRRGTTLLARRRRARRAGPARHPAAAARARPGAHPSTGGCARALPPSRFHYAVKALAHDAVLARSPKRAAASTSPRPRS